MSILGTVLLGANAATVVNKLGTDVIITAVTTSTGAIGRVLGYITSMDHLGVEDIKKKLEDIDLEFFINVLDQLVKEQKDKKTVKSVKIALIGMNKILEEIHKELNTIKESIEYHQSKYFPSWRSFNCGYNIDSIKKHKDLLYQRYEILTDLLTIYNR
jgi:hypothetical protein